MTEMKQQLETLRHQAADYARRASMATDPVTESGLRRLAHHYLTRAAELERSAHPERTEANGGNGH